MAAPGKSPRKLPPAIDGGLVERSPVRTPKSRAPNQSAGPKPKTSRSKSPKQQELPFRDGASPASGARERSALPRLLKIGGAIATLALLFTGIWLSVQLFSRSRFFSLRAVAVEGSVLLSREEVERIVKENTPDGVLRADLTLIREKLQQDELVKEVEVTRLLPDMLRVTIKEREPYTLARRKDGDVVCVDQNGVLFGKRSMFRGAIPPLVSGLNETPDAAAQESNRQRLLLYKQLLEALDQSAPPLSSRIDEVIFDETGGIRLILAESGVAVMVGKEDFRVRLNAALDVLDAVRRKDADALQVLRIADAEKLLSGNRVAYVNATIPNRVIVGLAE